jgi:hypothetical protein
VNGAERIDEFDGTNTADAMIGMEETRPIVIPLRAWFNESAPPGNGGSDTACRHTVADAPAGVTREHAGPPAIPAEGSG